MNNLTHKSVFCFDSFKRDLPEIERKKKYKRETLNKGCSNTPLIVSFFFSLFFPQFYSFLSFYKLEISIFNLRILPVLFCLSLSHFLNRIPDRIDDLLILEIVGNDIIIQHFLVWIMSTRANLGLHLKWLRCQSPAKISTVLLNGTLYRDFKTKMGTFSLKLMQFLNGKREHYQIDTK